MIRSLIRCNKQTIKPIIPNLTSTTTRNYFYTIDINGQLFLSDIKIRNFTSCLKDITFLDFFFNRIKPLTLLPSSHPEKKGEETNENEELLKYRKEGYNFISKCGKEINYIKPDDTVLVYQSLDPQKGLAYAGTLTTLFLPSSLRVCMKLGYLYHPSPPPSLRKQSRLLKAKSKLKATGEGKGEGEDGKGEDGNQFGTYSLLRSSLVLENFSENLIMFDQKANENEVGVAEGEGKEEDVGSYIWEGKRYGIKKLKEGMVLRSTC